MSSSSDQPVRFTLADILSGQGDLPVSVRVVECSRASARSGRANGEAEEDRLDDGAQRSGLSNDVITLHTVRTFQGQIEVFDETGKHLRGQIALNNDDYLFEVVDEAAEYEIASFDDVVAQFSSLGELVMASEKYHRRIVVCESTILDTGELLVAGSEIIVAADSSADYLTVDESFRAPCWRLAGQYNVSFDDYTLGLVYVPWHAKLPCALSPRGTQVQILSDLTELMRGPDLGLKVVPYPIVRTSSESFPPQSVVCTSPFVLSAARVVVATSERRGAYGLWCPPRTKFNWRLQVEPDESGSFFRRACRQLASQVDLRALPVWADDPAMPGKSSARQLPRTALLCHTSRRLDIWKDLEGESRQQAKRTEIGEGERRPAGDRACQTRGSSKRREESIDNAEEILALLTDLGVIQSSKNSSPVAGHVAVCAGEVSPFRPRCTNISSTDLQKRHGRPLPKFERDSSSDKTNSSKNFTDRRQLSADSKTTSEALTTPTADSKGRSSPTITHAQRQSHKAAMTPRESLLSDRYPGLETSSEKRPNSARFRYFPVIIGGDQRPIVLPPSGKRQIVPPPPPSETEAPPSRPIDRSSKTLPRMSPLHVDDADPTAPIRHVESQALTFHCENDSKSRSDSYDFSEQASGQRTARQGSRSLPRNVRLLPPPVPPGTERPRIQRSPSPVALCHIRRSPTVPIDQRPPMPEPRNADQNRSLSIESDSDGEDNYDLPYPTSGPLELGPGIPPGLKIPPPKPTHLNGLQNINQKASLKAPPKLPNDYDDHQLEKGSPPSAGDYLKPVDETPSQPPHQD